MKSHVTFRSAAMLVLCILCLSLTSPLGAQSYSYAVPQLSMQVYVQPDASVKIVYDITFANNGAPIEVIDIGTPHSGYDLGNMSASIDGNALSDIRTSAYIDVGVEVHLGEYAIPTGGEGTLHMEFVMPDMIYQDTTQRGYASLQITPTWFEPGSVSSFGTIQIAIHMLEGIEPDEVLYQKEPFTDKALYEGRAVAIWQWQDRSPTTAHLVGVSFPQRGLERVVKISLLDLTQKWLEDNPQTRMVLGAINVILLGVLFFRFSGGTGCSVFSPLAIGSIVLFVASALSVLFVMPLLVGLVIVNEVSLKKRRKKGYLPPIAQVEGGGIKRGLTAPESAVILEMPLNKILTLIIFGLLEKGVIEQSAETPLTVSVKPTYQTWQDAEMRKSIKARRAYRRQAAQQAGTVIHSYEDPFLDQLERNPGKPVERIDFTQAIDNLLKLTADKMKGFDLSDTQEYYRRVIDRAMQQAAALGDIQQREQYLDKYLPWVMMGEQYPTVLTNRGYQYWPAWSRAARASSGGAGKALSAPASSRPSVGGRTTAGDVAGSFAGWAETTMGGLAASILPGSLKVPSAKGGFVNLSGVDRVTGDVFQALAKSSGSGSRGGGGRSRGGCACACAGCACACACAGGGR